MLLELGMMNCFKNYLLNKCLYFRPTGNDEMCNFYIMYWVDGDQLLDNPVCQSVGPPNYYFRRDQVCFYLFNKISFLTKN